MKLIFEAIKSLFRGVSSTIEQTAATLGKRIDKAQSTADMAQSTANRAENGAAAAQAAVRSAYTWTEALYIPTGKTGEHSVVLPKFTELKIIGGLKNSGSTMKRMGIVLNGHGFVETVPHVNPKNWNTVQTEICADVSGFVVVKNVSHNDIDGAAGNAVTGGAYTVTVTDNNTLVLTLPAELTVYNRPLRVLYR